MEALKQNSIKRDGNKIVLILPDSFTAEEVDVLIWPSDKNNTIPDSNLSAELLSWPEMSDEELSSINEKRKHLNTWK